MKGKLARFYDFLGKPLFPASRIVLALLVIPLVLSFAAPLWRIGMVAPQYPEGLTLDIYSYTVEGGHEGTDLREINVLNHYIGMKKIDRQSLSDLDWIPFALGALAILTLRCAAIGTVRSLVDLAVITGYVSVFSMSRFYYQMYTFGHTLDPEAPVKMAPFTPVIIGTKQVANFSTTSYPATGTYLVGVYAVGLLALLAWHLVRGKRQAEAREAAAPLSEPAPQSA